jgi:aerobic carbon-monoxide dehydrogenase medium subunit
MYPAQFEYYRASTVQEALQLMAQHSGAKLLAGGHSLIPMMKLRLAQPPALIDIGRISDLAGVTESDNRLLIGSLTTHAELAASRMVIQHCPLLSEAAGLIADPQVRNKGTIGGNLAHADPGSDLPAVILALDGVLHMVGPDGDRQVKAKDFFLDLLTTELKPHEVLTQVELPILTERTGSSYLKFEHPASGYAVCGAAAILKLDADGTCLSAGLCFNGVSATPYRADNVTEALTGKKPDDATIEQIVKERLTVAEPMGDIYASGAYRAEIAKVYGGKALKTARDRASG